MDVSYVNDITKEAMHVLFSISIPILLLSLVVGLIISLFQALTQIQEMTLTFVPKILIIYLGLVVFVPGMLTKLQIFMDHIVQRINAIYVVI